MGRHRPQERRATRRRSSEIERLLDAGPARSPPTRSSPPRALLRFPCAPHLVAFSGSGGAHGYWRIEQTLAAEWIERANVRLIHHLGDGADYASYDRNRFMRLPGARNGKSGRYCQLVHADLTSRAYDVRDLVGEPARPARRRPARAEAHPPPADGAVAAARGDRRPRRPLDAARVLRRAVRHHRVRPRRQGRARCPIHDDPRASLWIGETPDAGWFCFGCGRGGRVFDLASLLIGGPWGADLRGDAFRAARAELERRLGVPIPGR